MSSCLFLIGFMLLTLILVRLITSLIIVVIDHMDCFMCFLFVNDFLFMVVVDFDVVTMKLMICFHNCSLTYNWSYVFLHLL